MKNVFSSMPPFRLGPPVPPELYIDRKEELRHIERALIARRHILIYGRRRIGKTSTLMKVRNILELTNKDNKNQKVFEAYLGYFTDRHGNLLDLFRHLVLDICYEILKREYDIDLPLLEVYDTKGVKDTTVKERNTLLTISQALQSNRTVSITETSKLGV